MLRVMPFQLIVKSLLIDKIQIGLITTVVTIITFNSTLLYTMLNGQGRLLVILFTFLSTLPPISLILISNLKGRLNQNIDVFKTLGARNRTIITSLLMELVLIGIAGTFIGTLFAILIAFFCSFFSIPPFILTFGYDIILFVGYILLSSILSIISGALAGVYCAWRK